MHSINGAVGTPCQCQDSVKPVDEISVELGKDWVLSWQASYRQQF